MEKVTLKFSHKDGKTLASNGHVNWDFGVQGPRMMDETIIASLVYQTIFMRFEKLKLHSDDFELVFTIEEKKNDNG